VEQKPAFSFWARLGLKWHDKAPLDDFKAAVELKSNGI
jgi:hypothetical protein